MSRKHAVLLSALLFLAFAACLLADSLGFLPEEGVRVQARTAEASLLLTGRDDPDAEALELLPGELVDINTASAEKLRTLPGIGEVLSQAIVDYRQENGPFTTLEQLMEVPGIGTGRYAAVAELITIGEIQ